MGLVGLGRINMSRMVSLLGVARLLLGVGLMPDMI
jgi:hypothetical protein